MRTLSQIKRDFTNAWLIADPVERERFRRKYNQEFIEAEKNGAKWENSVLTKTNS